MLIRARAILMHSEKCQKATAKILFPTDFLQNASDILQFATKILLFATKKIL